MTKIIQITSIFISIITAKNGIGSGHKASSFVEHDELITFRISLYFYFQDIPRFSRTRIPRSHASRRCQHSDYVNICSRYGSLLNPCELTQIYDNAQIDRDYFMIYAEFIGKNGVIIRLTFCDIFASLTRHLQATTAASLYNQGTVILSISVILGCSCF